MLNDSLYLSRRRVGRVCCVANVRVAAICILYTVYIDYNYCDVKPAAGGDIP